MTALTDKRTNVLSSICVNLPKVLSSGIEQLTEVAMVDITGLVERQLQIVPDENKLAVLGLSIQDVESALPKNNVEPKYDRT